MVAVEALGVPEVTEGLGDMEDLVVPTETPMVTPTITPVVPVAPMGPPAPVDEMGHQVPTEQLVSMAILLLMEAFCGWLAHKMEA